MALASLRLVALCVACVLALASASRFTFTLSSRTEECFMEDVLARSSDNKLLFRFGIIEPEAYDLLDVSIQSPSWKVVEKWNKTQGAHIASPVRESGLYQFCFTKRSGSSAEFTVYYSYDFISTGSPHMVLYPNLAGTLDRAASDATLYTMMQLDTKDDRANKIGIVDYSLNGVSSSVLRAHTRVQLLVSVEHVSAETVDISIAKYPRNIEYPLSWDSLGSYTAGGEYRQHIVDAAHAKLGSHLAFDVTEIFTEAVNSGKTQLAFSFHVPLGNAEVTLTGMSYTTPDYYPQLIIEDMGLDLMREVAFFKERVFTLKGDITYIKQKERASRNAAESANARVKWLSMLTNIVLVGIALVQVLYIRTMLETSY